MTSGRTAYSWSPEADAELRELWSIRGMTASEIGARMGKTRNAVLGRAHRLDLPMRKAATTGYNAFTRVRTPRAVVKRAPRKSTYVTKPRRKPEPKPVATEQQRQMAWAALPGSMPVALLDLTAESCRWPVGEAPFHFCGLKATQGSYCDHHAKLSRGLGTPSEQRAVAHARSAGRAERRAGERAREAEMA